MGGTGELSLRVPGDKSISQRALILGALALGESRIRGISRGNDVLATARALSSLGVELILSDESTSEAVTVAGRGLRSWSRPPLPLDLANSGTGARLILGALAAQPFSVELTGDPSLRSRPMERIGKPLREMGARFEYTKEPGVLPVRVTGGVLRPTRYETPVASAQVKSAVLLAGANGGVEVEVVEPRRSRDHTERMLHAMGCDLVEGAAGDRWAVRMEAPPDRLLPLDLEVPGDFSSAAFFLAWAALGPPGTAVTIRGVGLNPTRTGYLSVLARMGVPVELTGQSMSGGEAVGDLRIQSPEGLVATVVEGDEIPALLDEVPAIAALAARAEGVTRITGAEELRVKESDRLAALASNLREIGVAVDERRDGLEIEGTPRPLSGAVEAFGDHRIAMAFGVLGATEGCTIGVDHPEVTDVSFPGFWNRLAQLRGAADAASTRPVPSRPVPDRDRGGLVVTIDGPAGSGKTSTAGAVAARLGFRHLDSGAIYRAVTHGIIKQKPDMSSYKDISKNDLKDLAISVEWNGTEMAVRLAGRPVPERDLRAPEVTERVSHISGVPAVRDHLISIQRSAAEGAGLVAEGRDMGTVVFPEAQVKVYLVADPVERARRRLLETGEPTDPPRVQREVERLRARDERDSTREVAPLEPAPDSVRIDTTGLTFDEQVERIVELAERARRS